MIVRYSVMLSSLLCLLGLPAVGRGAAVVNESAREIPVAYRVDVVVVGGSTGAVQAAVAAAEGGAKVFLAAPYPYLGEDMTATLRLWLEDGEVPSAPLAKRIFADPIRDSAGPDPNRIELSYEVDVPSQAVHKDADPPSMLTDGRASNAPSQSVQYNSDAVITCDLKRSQPIREVRVVAFRRTTGAEGSNFDVQSVTVFAGDDKKSWKQIALIKNDKPTADGDAPFSLSVPVDVTSRYVKLSVKKRAGMERMLLGRSRSLHPHRQHRKRPRRSPPRRGRCT